MIRLVTAALAAAALLLPATASAFVFQERPGLNSPANGIVLGPDGNIWAAESTAGTVVRMTPAGQPIARYVVGAGPTSMAVGPGGRVWVSVTGADKLVWIDALSPTPITHDVSTAAGSNCGPVALVATETRMYFSVPNDGVCSSVDGIGFVNADGTGMPAFFLNNLQAFDLEYAGGKIFVPVFDGAALFRYNTGGSGLTFEADISAPGNPDGIAADGAGNVWLTLFASGKVARHPVTSNGAVTELTPVGGTLVNPFGIAAGPDGKIYVTGSESKNLARIDPATNAFTFYPLGTGTPWQLVNGPDGDLWFTDTVNPRLVRFVSAVPRSTTGAATATAATTANVAAKVNPRGNETQVVFDYGTTAAYGTSTPAQTLPIGTDPVDVQAVLTGLAPSTMYHVRVRATNSEGEKPGDDTTFTTPAAPVVVPPTPTLAAFVRFTAKVRKTYTQLTKLRIEKLVGGETAKVTCKGGKKKGCPFASKTYKNLKAGTFNLATRFGISKRKLRPGVVVSITVTKPGTRGRVATLTVRKRKAPTIVRRVL